MKKSVLLFLFLLTMVLASCSKGLQERPVMPVSVLVENPTKGRLERYLDLSADIVSPKEVNVSSDVSGKVISISQYQGSFVSRNQTIALIDRFVIGANYANAPARTPIAGYVTTVNAKIGQAVAAGETIAVVSDISELEIDIYVPEISVNDVKVGQTVKVSIPSSAGQEFEAKITKMDLEVNPTTRTLLAKAEINNKDRLFLPGMFSDVSILTRAEDDVVIVPNSAVFTQDEKNYVYVVDRGSQPPREMPEGESGESTDRPAGGREEGASSSGASTNANSATARLQEVELLFSSRDRIAIASGIDENDEVIVFGREFLSDGSSIIAIRDNPVEQ